MINRLGLVLLPTLALSACSAGSTGDPPARESTKATSAALTAPLRKVPQSANPYTLFETLQTRPLALSRDGETLYALNTPDNRLEIFKIRGDRLHPAGSVTVGLEPVAIAVRSDDEVWVVNHLSDSVSVVRVGDDYEGGAEVVRTLLVGDEPRDIVFAGPHRDRAFVTTAHRGQDTGDDPDLFANVGRADVWVFDANNLGAAPGGQRLAKLTFFADTPRALAVTPDGKTVYAAAFFSGNQTTTVAEGAVANVFPNGMPGVPFVIVNGQPIPQPATGLIVKYKGGHWLDAYGNPWDPAIKVSLPDQDVFAIDATASPPAAVSSGVYAHVGTTLFNMAVSPKSGKVYVTNTDAHNDVRFEGHTPGFTSVRGNMVDSRITIIDPATGALTADNLNPHLDHVAGTGDPSLSVAFPQDLTFSRDGSQLYVVAQGSSKLAIYDTAALEAGTATPSAANQVVLTGGGPTGVVTHGHHAFVLTRFDNSISVVNTETRTEVSHRAMFSPEPASVTTGRQFLYDATHTSTLGDQACASCHIGGDFDGLAWDLGNPGAIPLPITTLAAQESDIHTIPEAPLAALFGVPQISYIFAAYEPAKGPMTTQSLRGMDNHGAMHWRGDRNGAVQQTGLPFLDFSGAPVVSAQPNSGIFDEVNAFKSFNVAFPGLLGNPAQLSDGDMTDYASFALQITYPPNPIRNLDDSLTPEQQVGQAFYFNNAAGQELPSDRFHDCNGCHTLDRNGNAGASPHPGFFGSSGKLSFENETQLFKVPHLRNLYQKVGMYASSLDAAHAFASVFPPTNPPAAGVRGFGFQHDGATATVEHFLTGVVFLQTTAPVSFGGVNAPPNPFGIPLFNDPTSPFDPTTGVSASGLATRRGLASFIFAFDSNMRPVVGQQATLDASNGSALATRLKLFESQAALGNTDLVVHGRIFGRDAGFVYSNGTFLADVSWVPPLTDAQLRGLVGSVTSSLTFTCVPPGSGFRIGIDRDGDGYADGDEALRGSDPDDASSTL